MTGRFTDTGQVDAVLRDYIDRAPDNPLDTVSVELTLAEILVVVLGLNSVVTTLEEPRALICLNLVTRFIDVIGEQKEVHADRGSD